MHIDEISLKTLLEHAHLGVVIHTWNTEIVYANPAAMELLRLNYEQMLGKDAFDSGWEFIDQHNRRLHSDEYPVNKVIRLKTNLRDELVGVVSKDRPDVTWLKVNAYPEADERGAFGFVVVFLSEVTDEKVHFQFNDIVENAGDSVLVTEAGDIEAPTGPKIVYVNPAFCRMTGYQADEVIGETPRILQGSLTDTDATRRIHEALEQQEPVRETLLNYTKQGTPYWIEISVFPLRNTYGEVTHFAAVERDVSRERFQTEQLSARNRELKAIRQNLESLVNKKTRELRDANLKLEQLAYFDHLTQIPNRRAYEEVAKSQYSSAIREEKTLLIAIMDLDHFKMVNDDYGHGAGDEALKAVALCLKQFFRQEDAIGRIGGEEFALCMRIDKDFEADALLERLRDSVQQLSVKGEAARHVSISISIGAVVAAQPEHFDIDTLHDKADKALYRAKLNGRNRVELVRL